MGEKLTNRVRIEESHQAVSGLQGQIEGWADRRRRLDVLHQYRAHVNVLESVLLPVLKALAAALDRIDSARPVGEVYLECRRTENRLALVGRIWEWVRAKFDQRDDPLFGPLLAAADEVIWSCYAGVFDNAMVASGREIHRGLVPLPYIEFRSFPMTIPPHLGPPDLRLPKDDEIMGQFLEQLPLPFIGLPRAWVEAPWWLLLLGHEVGHQIQFDLVPELGLVEEFAELMGATATGGGDAAAPRWRQWSREIFADLCLLCTCGQWGIWCMTEQVLADERLMLAGSDFIPPAVTRLALLTTAATKLGVDGHAGLRGIDPVRLAADSDSAVILDLALVPPIATSALDHRLGGLGSFTELFAFDPSDFQPGGSVHRWAKALRTPGSFISESPVRSGRLIACGAVAAWSEVAAITDAAERKNARAMLREALLHELTQNQKVVQGATRATEPSAVTDLSHLVMELRQLTLAGFAQQAVKLDRIETGVSEIAKVTGIVQDQLRRWTVSHETISGTPRLFTLTPVRKRGLDKAVVWQDAYHLALWCEHADKPHPWQPARYQFNRPRDWLITVAPYALGVLKILRLTVNVAAPIGILADVDLDSIKDDLDAMHRMLDQFPTQLPDAPTAPDQAVQPIQADGPELRALRPYSPSLTPTGSSTGCMLSRHPQAISGGSARTTTPPTIPDQAAHNTGHS
jgi:hypothetical protein